MEGMVTFLSDHIQHAHGFGDNFWSNSVAGEENNVEIQFISNP